MNRPGRGAVYTLTLVAVVGGLVLIGAMGLNLMITGSPAFPVSVFGDARTSDKVTALLTIRPRERAVLPQGQFREEQLLPMPAIPAWMLAMRNSTDTLYNRFAALGLQGDLDRARAAAQKGSRALALRLYADLARRLPGDRFLLLERASVLASFGQHAEAATLLRGEFDRSPGDFDVGMLAARNAWWAEQPITADSLVGRALALRPANVEATRLRETIRSTTQPPLSVAREWARATGAPREHLLLARALVREMQYPPALGSYRLALTDARLATDSLLLEAASAAAAADSVEELDRLTERYLALHPEDNEAKLRLARAYSWRGQYAEALRNYRRVSWDDPAVRLEVGQVLLWSGDETGAARELRTVIAARPRDPLALKILGDLSLWQADWTTASAYYRRAFEIDPTMPGIREGLTASALGLEQLRLARLPRATPEGAGMGIDAFSDNQRFRWLTTRANRAFRAGGALFNATVQHMVFEGAPTGFLSRNPGASLRVEAAYDLWSKARIELLAGADQYTAVQSFAVFGGGITIFDLAGVQAGIEYKHQPGAPRAATFAALQARATSDMLAVNVATTRGRWSTTVRGEAEQFASTVGGVNRLAASANVTRVLTPRLAASLGLSALRVDRASPVLPGFGNVIWAPSSYVEPSVGLSYRQQVASGLTAGLGGSLGYGFARERPGDARFGAGALPTGALNADLQSNRGRWNVVVAGSYGGALLRGYRAAVLRVQASYRIGR